MNRLFLKSRPFMYFNTLISNSKRGGRAHVDPALLGVDQLLGHPFRRWLLRPLLRLHGHCQVAYIIVVNGFKRPRKGNKRIYKYNFDQRLKPEFRSRPIFGGSGSGSNPSKIKRLRLRLRLLGKNDFF